MSTRLSEGIASTAAAKFWPELKKLNNDEKLNLIVLLSSSMVHTEKDTPSRHKGWASRFAGVWKDCRSAEEIVADIQAARTSNTFKADL